MATTAAGTIPFHWEGTDRKGNKIKGKTMAINLAAVRADLRRQGVVPRKIRKQSLAPVHMALHKPEALWVELYPDVSAAEVHSSSGGG